MPQEVFEDVIKRALDLTLSGLALGALAVPLTAVAIAIKVDTPGPVFYRGPRIGRGGRAFKIFKFRSMRVDASKGPTSTSENDPRITPVGRFLRRYKLDELPQLINVVKGEMSLVGPRPEVARFVDLYTEEEKAILSIRPGLTDWASIRFHNEGEIIAASGISDPDDAYAQLIRPEKLRLQLRYLRERTSAVDIRIIATTLGTLLRTRTQESRDESSVAQ
jgi:lipopolysaccharide/colanic/teichoic acid biosynthesis glycosyltransferase